MAFSSPDLIGYLYHKYSDGQVRIIVKIDGVLDESRLAKAVRLAFDAEPVTGCRFVKKPVRPYWHRCADFESAFEFREVDSSDHEKGINEFLLAHMDPFNGPQVKVGLYRSGFDTLYIKISHIVADGAGSMEYLKVLSGIYRHLEKDPEYKPDRNIDGSRNSFQALKHIERKKIISACTKIRVSWPAWKFSPNGNGHAAIPSFITRRIEVKRLSVIKAYAKEHGVTIGDVVLTAYYRAMFEVIDPAEGVPLPILVPVNVRRYIPGGDVEGICNLSGAYFPKIARMKNETFDETLAKVKRVMERKKAGQEELGQLFILDLIFAPGRILQRILDPFLASVLAVPMFSNLGVISKDVADFGGVKVREINQPGPMISPPYFTLGSSTFDGEMTLEATVCGHADYLAKVEGFFDVLVKELPGYMPEDVDIVQEMVATKKPVQEMIMVKVREKAVLETS